MVVVVGGNVLHHVKRDREYPGGGIPGRNMSDGGIVQRRMFGSPEQTPSGQNPLGHTPFCCCIRGCVRVRHSERWGSKQARCVIH